MYQNANRLLLLKDNSPKTTMRHSITLSRIEQNLRKMKSMIHILPPPTFDDMLLFSSIKNNDDGQITPTSAYPPFSQHICSSFLFIWQ